MSNKSKEKFDNESKQPSPLELLQTTIVHDIIESIDNQEFNKFWLIFQTLKEFNNEDPDTIYGHDYYPVLFSTLEKSGLFETSSQIEQFLKEHTNEQVFTQVLEKLFQINPQAALAIKTVYF
jgi:hypothetical protein